MRLNIIRPDLSPGQMVEKRRKLLTFALVTFAAWQGCRIFTEVDTSIEHAPGAMSMIHFIEGFTLGLWIATIIFLVFFIQRLFQRPVVAAIIDDELYKANRLKAGYFAFFFVLGAEVILSVVSAFHPLTATVGADVTILVAVTSFIGSTVYLDRD